ncbi:hypothetical protein MASR2M54_26310 [Aliarcobacter cryaerophilus]
MFLQEFIFQDLSVKNITIKGLQLINIQVILCKYLDEEYISLTDEEKAFESTKKNLEKVIKIFKM